ncbi:uncharacterized protein DNG_07930 [Cephalotrichum gorgonifer]|uniref:Uncharacterized protein n=1 Tax=Cephalotrichum gorgonifer TaxID=2041049 RepID=A0AAE8N529_9PEZI|nr:uncharacterized protein DNG_07930 [Cephalotrichum gorgonifer]
MLSKTALNVSLAAGFLFQTAVAGPVDSTVLVARQSSSSGPGCGENEVAVGLYQTCTPAPGPHPVIPPDGGCGAQYGALWEGTSCDGEAFSLSGMTEGFCDGGFKNDISVRCNGNGDAEAILSHGILVPWLSECRKHEVTCRRTIGISSAYSEIKFCCGVNLAKRKLGDVAIPLSTLAT